MTERLRLAKAWLASQDAILAWETDLGARTRICLQTATEPDAVAERSLLDSCIRRLHRQAGDAAALAVLWLYGRDYAPLAARIETLPVWQQRLRAECADALAKMLLILPPPAMPQTLSIMVPTYNRLATLKRTVAAILAQTHADWRLLIGDDGSTDGTEAFCRMLAAGDARISYHRNSHNLGHGKTLERLYDLAETELVTNCSDDDWFYPNHVSTNLKLFADYPWIAMSSGGINLVNFAGELCVQHGPFAPVAGIASNRRELQRCGLICPVGPGAVLRKSILEEFAPLDRIVCTEGERYAVWDYLLTIKVAGKYEFAYSPDILGAMEVNQASNYQKRDLSAEILYLLEQLLTDYQRLYGPGSYPLILAERLLGQARERVLQRNPQTPAEPGEDVWQPYFHARERLVQTCRPERPQLEVRNPYSYLSRGRRGIRRLLQIAKLKNYRRVPAEPALPAEWDAFSAPSADSGPVRPV